MKTLEGLQYGTMSVVLPDGKQRHFEGAIEQEPKANITLHSVSVITNLLAKGDIGFAESYRQKEFETTDLTALITVALKNSEVLQDYLYGSFFSNIAAQILYYCRSNSIRGSRRNIHAHYDLGNAFYKLWLDPTMTYSSAIFHNDNQSLTQAQHNKYDRIVDRFERRSGNVLEVGCGWGGFAERALDHGDYGIKGITISNEQHHFARKRLGQKANIALEDYRKQTGLYDHIVSIEMFEAVGEKYWATYFNKMKSLLSQKGKAVIQTITIKDSYFERYRKTGDMVRSFIFPGGMLPSVPRFQQEAKKAGLSVVDHFAFGQHYAKTIQCWLESFENNLDQIRKLGFDDAFIRIWRFYLSACIASFSVERTNVIQAEICHA